MDNFVKIEHFVEIVDVGKASHFSKTVDFGKIDLKPDRYCVPKLRTYLLEIV